MNARIHALAVATVLLALASPAFAQRASLAERVTSLERQAAAGQGNVDLLRQLGQLKDEVQALRAQIEEMQHTQQQWQETSRVQYLDVDSRLVRLEGGTPVPAPVLDAVLPPPPPAAAAVDSPAVPPPAPVQAGDAERANYAAAFDMLKAGRYDESARLFQTFLQQFPDGGLAPNALYWLGESYYATQAYELALGQFQALLQRYPRDAKAPGALLKLGLTQYGMQQQAAAERTLAAVVERYPDSDAARTAADRLRAMQLSAIR